jgi:hypothetical protein
MASRFRHEDREAVPKGWKVRTVKAGKHRVRVAFPPGRKVKGSGRLVSILHPLGENPCELRSANPAELMVMSANNPPRTRNAFAYRVVAVPRWGGSPVTQDFPTREAAKDHARGLSKETYFKPHIQKVRKAGSNPAELLVMGANPRVEVVSSPNPPTEEIVEEFTGRPVEYLDVYNEPHMKRGRYGKLGPLVALYVKPAKGGQVQRIGAPEAVGDGFPEYWNNLPPLIVTDSTARQIYFVDGTQDISNCLHLFTGAAAREGGAQGIYELGQVRRIDYQCRKEVASPEEDLWKHDHGEENGVLPTLLFDATNKRLLYEGGDYRIEGPWIHN